MTKPKDRQIVENQMLQAQEMHCPGCGRFLGYQAILWGTVRIKCPNCKEWTTIDIRPEQPL